MTNARRLDPPNNDEWEVHVEPDGDGAVTIELPVATDCMAQGAICTGDRRPLSSQLEVTVAGPGEAQQTPANAPATGVPTISGTAQVGETLEASTSGIGDDDGLSNVSYGYRWVRSDGTSDADIQDATGPSYTLVEADEGKTVKVRVSFTDDAGNGEELTSAATALVAAAVPRNSPAIGAPTVSGTAQVGETLTADTTGISDADGLDDVTFTYQWLADGAEINGATASTYTLAEGDEGKAIRVRVFFTDDAGNGEELTSAATAAVVSLPMMASAHEVPSSHNGRDAFTFELRFSEEPKLSYTTLRDHAFTVTGGEVTQARRLERPSNMRWEITVRPDSSGTVSVVLPVTGDCEADGAIRTEDGRRLSSRLEVTVNGP